jgi:hypothetical protein
MTTRASFPPRLFVAATWSAYSSTVMSPVVSTIKA